MDSALPIAPRRIHLTRLMSIWRSAGWPCRDAVLHLIDDRFAKPEVRRLLPTWWRINPERAALKRRFDQLQRAESTRQDLGLRRLVSVRS
jgi:hypothetical protein